MLELGGSPRGGRLLFVWMSLAFAVVGALGIVMSVVSPALGQARGCENTAAGLRVPGADRQQEYCLPDLTTKGLVDGVHTNRSDWEGA